MTGLLPPLPGYLGRLPNVAYSAHVGRFYRAEALRGLPANVNKGQLVGVVKALGLEFPVLAPCTGWVESVHVPCDAPVEYGQALVSLRTNA
jgi:biotin carboxyl carrier protein